MSEFVSVRGDLWANVDHIVYIQPWGADGKACVVHLSTGDHFIADTPARDFLNRMTGVVWK